ncbi:hypothetical protein [Paenibacillus sp. A3]|uniref:hypothetical protein n=1 Tax=Paenibacillus sp. A3 TaxID=1337054 RepID=UPI0012FBD4EF|nr:hypothetical protein [Paenibacillus sp. A3]
MKPQRPHASGQMAGKTAVFFVLRRAKTTGDEINTVTGINKIQTLPFLPGNRCFSSQFIQIFIDKQKKRLLLLTSVVKINELNLFKESFKAVPDPTNPT